MIVKTEHSETKKWVLKREVDRPTLVVRLCDRMRAEQLLESEDRYTDVAEVSVTMTRGDPDSARCTVYYRNDVFRVSDMRGLAEILVLAADWVEDK